MTHSFRRFICSSLAVAALTAGAARTAHAQASDTAAIKSELSSIRQSLDQVVVVLKELLAQNTRRDLNTVLSQRLETAERRLTAAENELKDGRARKTAEELELVRLRGGLEGFLEMAKADTTGSAAGPIETEKQRMAQAIDLKAAQVSQVTQDVIALEASVAARRQAVNDLEQALNRQLGVGK